MTFILGYILKRQLLHHFLKPHHIFAQKQGKNQVKSKNHRFPVQTFIPHPLSSMGKAQENIKKWAQHRREHTSVF